MSEVVQGLIVAAAVGGSIFVVARKFMPRKRSAAGCGGCSGCPSAGQCGIKATNRNH